MTMLNIYLNLTVGNSSVTSGPVTFLMVYMSDFYPNSSGDTVLDKNAQLTDMCI